MTKLPAPDDDDDDDLGPAMAALLPRQRAFVQELFNKRPAPGRISAAYRAAGYGEGSSPDAVAANASRLTQNPNIQAAIKELTVKVAGSLAPEALDVLREIMHDPTHKDRARVASQFVERAAPQVQQIAVTHEDITPASRDREMVAYLRKLLSLGVSRQKLEDELGYSALPKYERLMRLEDQSKGIVDAEFTEVPFDPRAGLEDLLR